jgi:ADP-ribose 1''-phosphate phosphatase
MIEYRKGDLFSISADGRILLHAVNGVGKWGSGIAAEFAKRYPNAYQIYTYTCQKNLAEGNKAGYGFLVSAEAEIGCLVTSHKYGPQKDSPEQILKQTQSALREFLALKHVNAYLDQGYEIHSPKINAGLFAVPWKETVDILEQELKLNGKNIKWVVWEL